MGVRVILHSRGKGGRAGEVEKEKREAAGEGLSQNQSPAHIGDRKGLSEEKFGGVRKWYHFGTPRIRDGPSNLPPGGGSKRQ